MVNFYYIKSVTWCSWEVCTGHSRDLKERVVNFTVGEARAGRSLRWKILEFARGTTYERWVGVVKAIGCGGEW